MMENPKCFDMDYAEVSFEHLQRKYGLKYRRAQVPAGKPVYRLMVLREKTGHSSLITQVLDVDGRPIDQQDIAFYWPGAPRPPEPPTEVYPHDWFSNFIHGLSNLNGEVGPGMGSGAWIPVDPNPPHNALKGGPHAVWVRDPDIPSDICEGLGMRGGTNHDHVDQVFQLVGAEPDEPEPHYGKFVWMETDEVPTDRNILDVETTGDSALNFYDTRFYARWVNPVSGVPIFVFPEVFHPEMRKIQFDTTYAGEEGEVREFQFRVVDWREEFKDAPLSGWIAGDLFYPAGEIRRYNVKVKWQPKEPPATTTSLPVVISSTTTTLPQTGWTIEVERRAGIKLLAGVGLPVGTQVTVSAPWGSPVTLIAGSKAEWGPGGWEMNVWHGNVTYTIGFLSEVHTVNIGENETVVLHFVQGELPEPQARLVSPWISESEAMNLLDELESDGFSIFNIERET